MKMDTDENLSYLLLFYSLLLALLTKPCIIILHENNQRILKAVLYTSPIEKIIVLKSDLARHNL